MCTKYIKRTFLRYLLYVVTNYLFLSVEIPHCLYFIIFVDLCQLKSKIL
uniref:Uncharacterized protein n=1 Tax=Siphoviridae sp. ctqSm5 TaxID=2827949 RepID=A0A8S5SNV4_9CAUD|nr:MAG TPA: hypothetical protein [Siphoviridae sp. ctqSm5]